MAKSPDERSRGAGFVAGDRLPDVPSGAANPTIPTSVGLNRIGVEYVKNEESETQIKPILFS